MKMHKPLEGPDNGPACCCFITPSARSERSAMPHSVIRLHRRLTDSLEVRTGQGIETFVDGDEEAASFYANFVASQQARYETSRREAQEAQRDFISRTSVAENVAGSGPRGAYQLVDRVTIYGQTMEASVGEGRKYVLAEARKHHPDPTAPPSAAFGDWWEENKARRYCWYGELMTATTTSTIQVSASVRGQQSLPLAVVLQALDELGDEARVVHVSEDRRVEGDSESSSDESFVVTARYLIEHA